MSKLPQVSGKDAIKAFQKIGFVFESQKGSHVKLIRTRNDQSQVLIVPLHKTLKPGTLRNGILKSIPLTVKEFIELLRK